MGETKSTLDISLEIDNVTGKSSIDIPELLDIKYNIIKHLTLEQMETIEEWVASQTEVK